VDEVFGCTCDVTFIVIMFTELGWEADWGYIHDILVSHSSIVESAAMYVGK